MHGGANDRKNTNDTYDTTFRKKNIFVIGAM